MRTLRMNVPPFAGTGRALLTTVLLWVVGLVGTVVSLFVFVDVTDFLFGRATLSADFALLSAVILVTGAVLASAILSVHLALEGG